MEQIVVQYEIYPEGRDLADVCVAESFAALHKSIFKITGERVISIRIRGIVEIAAKDYGKRGIFY